MANAKKEILIRVYIAFFMVVALAVAVTSRIVHLQTVKRVELKSLADSITTDFVSIDPIRGNIYASDGSLMATSIPIYEARWDTKVENLDDELFYANVDSLAWCISNYFKDRTKEDYKKRLVNARKRGDRYFLIKRKLTHGEIKDIQKFPIFRLGRYKSGFIAEQMSRRILPFGELAQRTVGYSRKGLKPVGLEGAFDSYLAGQKGMRLMQRMSGGVMVPINNENELEPKDGQDIITTIDINYQDAAEAALRKYLMRNDAAYGCAVVMEVKTGEIKAIANLTRVGEGNYIEAYNYAIGQSTEPGSTFKLVSVMALLEHEKANAETIVDTRDGTVKFFDRVMRDSKDGHGKIPLKDAFAISSNVGISSAVYEAYASKPQQFTDFIHELKIDQPLGVPIAGEGKPVFKTPKEKSWSGITLPWMSIGYELRMTPLQQLTVYNAVANNGEMVKPRFVKEIREAGRLVAKYEKEVINEKICSDETLTQLRAMLEEVVDSGTADNIKNDLYKIAGKTGTALVANARQGYRQQNTYQASFAGYFPADDPKYSCIVIITNPSNGIYYGSAVAAPVFKEVADKIYSQTAQVNTYLTEAEEEQVPELPLKGGINKSHLSSLLDIYENDKLKIKKEDTWVKPIPAAQKIHIEPLAVASAEVPDVRGMVLSDALYVMERQGLRVKFMGTGKVSKQSLPPGAIAEKSRYVTLYLN